MLPHYSFCSSVAVLQGLNFVKILWFHINNSYCCMMFQCVEKTLYLRLSLLVLFLQSWQYMTLTACSSVTLWEKRASFSFSTAFTCKIHFVSFKLRVHQNWFLCSVTVPVSLFPLICLLVSRNPNLFLSPSSRSHSAPLNTHATLCSTSSSGVGSSSKDHFPDILENGAQQWREAAQKSYVVAEWYFLLALDFFANSS